MDLERGLTQAQAEEKARQGLANGDLSAPTKTVGEIIRTNVVTFFNILNLALAIIVFAVGSYKNTLFMGVILVNTLVGIIQELRAKKIIDKLSLISSPKARVIRDGREREIPNSDIVLGDLAKLSSGMQVCSDCRVVSDECEVNESLITGESDPILKKEGDELLSGSFVVSGEVKAQVVRVGEANFAARITKGAKYLKRPNSQMLTSMDKLIKIIAVCIVPIGCYMFYKSIFVTGENFAEAVTSSVAAIIAMIPEGLVLLISIVFAVSAVRLARHNALVQDMYCVETLARVDTLCLDKTGTITTGNMCVCEVIPLVTQKGDATIEKAMVNVMNALPDDNPTACAIREYFSGGQKPDPRWVPTQVVPFSSAKKWSGVSFRDKGTYIIGATEFVLGKIPEQIKQITQRAAQDSNRVVLIAGSKEELPDKNLPSEIIPLAVVVISETVRPEARQTLEFFAEQGVDIKIISGDNPLTVANIAQKVGVVGAEDYVDMTGVKSEEVENLVSANTVFGRVSPDQKLMIIKSLKAQGHTVAMTGDGVNDVLALKEADCSIAMQSGSDAARNVSSVVLLDSNFQSLPRIVAEGRRSINNVERSATLFLVKTTYAAILALLFLFIQEPFPFIPIQQTIINGCFIGLPSFILALEPNKKLIRGRFLENVLKRALPYGICCAVGVVAVTIFGHAFGFDIDIVRTLSTYVLGLTSFAVLCRICMPFDKLKITLIGFTILLFAAVNIAFPDLLSHERLSLAPSLVCVGICVACVAMVLFLPRPAERLVAAYKKRKYKKGL